MPPSPIRKAMPGELLNAYMSPTMSATNAAPRRNITRVIRAVSPGSPMKRERAMPPFLPMTSNSRLHGVPLGELLTDPGQQRPDLGRALDLDQPAPAGEVAGQVERDRRADPDPGAAVVQHVLGVAVPAEPVPHHRQIPRVDQHGGPGA